MDKEEKAIRADIERNVAHLASHRACPSVRSEIRKNRWRRRDVGG